MRKVSGQCDPWGLLARQDASLVASCVRRFSSVSDIRPVQFSASILLMHRASGIYEKSHFAHTAVSKAGGGELRDSNQLVRHRYVRQWWRMSDH